MDALGHVNNIMYFRYFEQTRLEWFESLGYPVFVPGADEVAAGRQPDDRDDGHGMVIVDNHAEYVRPLVYPATITVRMGGHSPGRSSFVSTYAISVGDVLFTRGSAKIVWMNVLEGRSAPLPEKVRSLIEMRLQV
ncbi:MAG: thioesterase superfamily protein [Gammaproteobacteria bacterium]|nr:MAG: thioesterase superfamily protein [Gammaproteobacteria bacterium]PIE37687.1 MAG: thioesterase superfamily protein [Gammaproteobacteria bacterium]